MTSTNVTMQEFQAALERKLRARRIVAGAVGAVEAMTGRVQVEHAPRHGGLDRGGVLRGDVRVLLAEMEQRRRARLLVQVILNAAAVISDRRGDVQPAGGNV